MAGLDALERPAIRLQHDPFREHVGLRAGVLARYLDDDLMDGRLDRAAKLVALLRDDREGRDELAHAPGERIDLGRRDRATGEDTEVDSHLDPGLLARPHAECDGRFSYLPRGSHENFNAVMTIPATPQPTRTAIAPGSVQKL